ncbi:fructan beta-fructosidase [Mesobacillus foraminis]|uniref:Fructan beta-fructosidase n=1 Tax=Mesobacillus foraminis TaxID=279826 RepID=A0A4R2BIX1_9BACI|nr:fructan beta-fructosidase [Mesobacillus foraminis]
MQRKRKLGFLVICFLMAMLPSKGILASNEDYYNEPFRNQFHFSPEANWMNDPNGMVYYQGEYHLFYQYHPYGTTWGPMHWGHAVSEDLIHWEHLPIALSPDENGQIFSGSAVIDWDNTAGFGKEAMIAIFTHAGEKDQVQSIAYSLDKGRTWETYKGNPVMPDPPIPDWRDPKVFWHEDSNQWVMSLAAKDKIMFYTSPNLKEWKFASEFGQDGGIQANSLDQTSYAISSQSGGSFSYEGEITLNEKNGREGSGGLVFRADKSAKNGYVVSLDAKNDRIMLSKNVDGTNEELARKSFPLHTSAAYHVKVETKGEHIQVFVNGQSIIEKLDSEFDSGFYGLTAWNSTAAFRNVKFQNTTSFQTNLSKWKVVSGSWTDSMEGKSGSSLEDAFIISGQIKDNFIYEASIKVSGTKGGNGAGALVFRADPMAANGYMANIDALNNTMKMMKLENGKISVLAEKEMNIEAEQAYNLKVSAIDENIKVYLNDQLIHDIVDGSYSKGQLGLNVWNSSTTFQNVQSKNVIITDDKEIINHDFEAGDLTGWKVIQGNAFTDDHVTDTASYWGGSFEHQGSRHLWGFSDLHQGDDATGELRSSYFKLDGNGEINLLIGGGNGSNRYVSLVRASDDQELIRQTNTKFADEKYKKYVWDASEFIGEVLYIKVVDQAAGGWGHINIDDVNVYNQGPMPSEVDQVAKEPDKGEAKQNGILTDWNAVSGEWIPSTNGSIGGIWECPALVELPIDGNPSKTKWVLQVSINDGAPAGGSGMQYFVGNFDGKTFKNDNPSDQVLWTDYGADFYAAVDWNGIEGENGEKYWLGWMSNWQYANHTPTSTWRSSNTLPRKMELTQTDEGLRLKQTPVPLNSIREMNKKTSYTNEIISGDSSLLSQLSGDTFEMIAEFDANGTKATEFGFEVRKGDRESTTIGYDVGNKKLFVDRSHSDSFDYGSNVIDKHQGPLNSSNGTVKMHIFVDRSAVEVFGNNGETVITDQIFPDPSSNGLNIYSKGGEVTLKSLEIYPLKSIWRDKSPFKSNLSNWTPINGKWANTINGKQGQSDGDAFILTNQIGKDFKYEADIKVLDSDSHPNDPERDTVQNPIGAGALVFRSDASAKNAYAVNIDVKNDVVKLIKFVDGKGYVVKSYNNEGNLNLIPNTSYHLKVTAAGESIRAYLDGRLVIDARDPSFTQGFMGLNVWDSTAVMNHVKYKEIKAKK